MKTFDAALVVTHIAYRKDSTRTSIEGPYSFLAEALSKFVKKVDVFGLPLIGYDMSVVHGEWKCERNIRIPKLFGSWLSLKFATDTILNTLYICWWSAFNQNRNKIVIGVDPLSCLPLWILKKLLGYTLVFHCVDFNKNRFGNPLLQRAYELSDKWASKYSDETWVICEALKEYKKRVYGTQSIYIPNSVPFNGNLYKNGKDKRTGNKIVWTGSLMTNRQFDILFEVFFLIQNEIRSDIKFVIAPTRDHSKFKKYLTKYKIKNSRVLSLNGRYEFQKVAATCDAGIALYDEQFGSTEFIEPMKIWDFLLCGLPFIVSSEPSVSKPIKNSGVAYFMNPKNVVPDKKSLKHFLSKKNLIDKSVECLKIAERYDFEKQVSRSIKVLSSKLLNK